MSVSITEAELLEALAHSQKPGAEGARTVQEMAAETGIPEPRIRRALQALHREGRLTAYYVSRLAIDGHARRVPAYSITKKKK